MIIRVTATRACTGSTIVTLHRIAKDVVAFFGPNKTLQKFAQRMASAYSCAWMLECEVATEHEFNMWTDLVSSFERFSDATVD